MESCQGCQSAVRWGNYEEAHSNYAEERVGKKGQQSGSRDLPDPARRSDLICVFDLGASGVSDIATDKDAAIGKALYL